MFDHYLRPMKDRWLTPVARALGPRVSPDAITAAAFAAGLGSAAAVLGGMKRVALGLGSSTACGRPRRDAGARPRPPSRFGAYLDIVLDFVVYAAIPMAIAWRHGTLAMAFAALALVATFYVNAASWMYLAALLEQRNDGAAARGETTAVTMPPGLIGGAETVAFYAAFLLWPEHQRVLFATMAALVLVNVAARLLWARRHL